MIYYKLFDEKINITSVVIPSNDEYKNLMNVKSLAGSKKDNKDDQIFKVQSVIADSLNSINVRNNLNKIYISFYNSIFSPKDIVTLLNVAPNTATHYINKLKNLNLLDNIKGIGQSKYRFKSPI